MPNEVAFENAQSNSSAGQHLHRWLLKHTSHLSASQMHSIMCILDFLEVTNVEDLNDMCILDSQVFRVVERDVLFQQQVMFRNVI
jgi:hypothetical protein